MWQVELVAHFTKTCANSSQCLTQFFRNGFVAITNRVFRIQRVVFTQIYMPLTPQHAIFTRVVFKRNHRLAVISLLLLSLLTINLSIKNDILLLWNTDIQNSTSQSIRFHSNNGSVEPFHSSFTVQEFGLPGDVFFIMILDPYSNPPPSPRGARSSQRRVIYATLRR